LRFDHLHNSNAPVGKGHVHVGVLFGDVELPLGVGAHVHAHDLVHVVAHRKVQVRVQVPDL